MPRPPRQPTGRPNRQVTEDLVRLVATQLEPELLDYALEYGERVRREIERGLYERLSADELVGLVLDTELIEEWIDLSVLQREIQSAAERLARRAERELEEHEAE
jgi:hypothetical protein